MYEVTFPTKIVFAIESSMSEFELKKVTEYLNALLQTVNLKSKLISLDIVSYSRTVKWFQNLSIEDASLLLANFPQLQGVPDKEMMLRFMHDTVFTDLTSKMLLVIVTKMNPESVSHSSIALQNKGVEILIANISAEGDVKVSTQLAKSLGLMADEIAKKIGKCFFFFLL